MTVVALAQNYLIRESCVLKTDRTQVCSKNNRHNCLGVKVTLLFVVVVGESISTHQCVDVIICANFGSKN